MLHSRELNFGVSRLKIRVFKVKNYAHYAPHAQTRFFLLTLKIHVLGHKLDTLCSTRADPIFPFRGSEILA